MSRKRNKWFAFFVYFVIFIFLASVAVSFVAFWAPSSDDKNWKDNLANQYDTWISIDNNISTNNVNLEYLSWLSKIVSSGAINENTWKNIDISNLWTGTHLIEKK